MTKKSKKSCKSAVYSIFASTAPAMPKPGIGTTVIDLIISQASKDMREPLVPMAMPALASHLSGVTYMYSNNLSYELCGQMGHLVGVSGIGKGQLTSLVKVITKSSQDHDKDEYEKLSQWQREVKSRGANKTKPERPDVYFLVPPANLTNPAFIQNAMALEKAGNLTQYLNLPEIEMANTICGGHRQVSNIIRNIYDVQPAGALRSSADGVTGNPVLRVNMTFSSTPEAARAFYKRDMLIGTFGRVPFAYKARGERKGVIPRQGQYDEDFQERIDQYLEILDNSRGNFIVKPLNILADKLAKEMLDIANLCDDDFLHELSHRCILSAWKKGCVLWLLNGQEWTRSIGEFVRWFCYYDLWSKVMVFGDMFKNGDGPADGTQNNGIKNMLDDLGESFTEQQLTDLRVSLGKSADGTRHQINVWKNRRFITYSEETGLYSKTDAYHKRK